MYLLTGQCEWLLGNSEIFLDGVGSKIIHVELIQPPNLSLHAFCILLFDIQETFLKYKQLIKMFLQTALRI